MYISSEIRASIEGNNEFKNWEFTRASAETEAEVTLESENAVDTGIGFFDHMLELLLCTVASISV